MLSEQEDVFRNSRGFDKRGQHENGTFYDDEGYDWAFMNEDGKVRGDKVPPYKGTYILAILAAVDAATKMAYKTMVSRRAAQLEMPSVELSSARCTENTYDIGEFYGSRGVFSVSDADVCGIFNYGFEFAFWDEETGEKRMDSEDFCHALSQIGEAIISEAGDEENRDSTDEYLIRTARLLMTSELWSDGAEAWAAKVLRGLDEDYTNVLLRDIAGWDDSLQALRRKVEEEKAQEEEKMREERAAWEAACVDEMPF
jgi:hypothetical protein